MTDSNPSKALDYPALWGAAEAASEQAQHTFYWFKALELLSLTLGAVFGLLSDTLQHILWPLLAVLMFASALGLQLSRSSQAAERRWYDARAAAESIKSASWQYAVGGEAFRLESPNVDAAYVERLQQILAGLKHLDIGAATSVAAVITPDMHQLRQSSQQWRYRRYAAARVDDQVRWYTRKAAWNKRKSRSWWAALVCVEAVALLAGLLRVAGCIDLDLLGVLGACGASLLAWIQAKNYTQLAESYAVTSHEVSLVAQAVRADVDEARWAQSVHDAEAAFSREHTMWVARRQGPTK